MASAETFVATLKLPSGNPPLDLYSFEGTEALSRLYSYSVVALGLVKDVVQFDNLLGKPAEIKVHDDGGADRHYHGLIASARFEGSVGKHHAYRFEVVPWLWLLTRSANVRVFQKLTTIEIIKKVFAPYGGAFQVAASGTYRKREYCVQYRESDFNFVSRLMEDEGIYYFFRHGAGKHEMVLADAANVHANELGVSSLDYNANARRRTQSAVVTRWAWSKQIQTGKVTVRDHHFMTPAQNYEKAQTGQATFAHGKIEAYDHAIGLPTFADEPAALNQLAAASDGIAKHRLEAFQAGVAAVDGGTSSLRLCNGARFKLAEHPVTSQNAEYIVQSTSIRVRIGGYDSGAHKDSSHECEFTAFPSAVPHRAPRITPRPRVYGLHSATVVGPAGEEIFVDKYGRVKVQFHWDREGTKDDKSSCFVRVAQPSAGKGFGVIMIPRIGHEVVVDFIEGDPDQPLIVGGVYNAENMPPYELPAHKAVSTWKSRSLQGTTDDYNEVRFDDTKGSEYMMLRAQKDRDDIVLNNQISSVGNNEERTIGKNSTLSIGEDYALSVGKATSMAVANEMMLDVGKALQIASGDTMGTTVAKSYTVDAGTDFSMKAGTDVFLKSGTNFGAEAGTNVHLKGAVNVVIEAGVQLTIKAGGSSVVLGPDGVSITGALVKMNSGGGPGSGSGAKPVKPTKPVKPKKPPELKDPLAGKHR